jgi:hypothetical protein
LSILAVTTDAQAVPSFTRQTGLTCNQCHVSFGGPVPNFTWTGKLFRINGYRMPFIADKIEAGEVGAINGKRLALPLIPYISFRYQSTFASQSRRPGADEASSISSNPTSRLSIFPGGAFGDNLGVWIELYLTPDGSATGEWTQGVFSFDEYDLRFTKMNDNSTIGLSFSNQSIREIAGFGPWPVGMTSFMNRAGFRGWSHTSRAVFYLYGFFSERLLAVVGAGPGEDNFDWQDQFFQGQLAYAFANTDHQEAWLMGSLQAGNDGIPVITNISPSRDGLLSWSYRDAVSGISGTRDDPDLGPYLSSDLGDYVRFLGEARYGFIDRGPNSVEFAVRGTYTTEDYADNAEVQINTIGAAVRYVYDRTWGFDAVTETNLTYDFTDSSGNLTAVDVPQSYTAYLSFRPAMNAMIALRYGNSRSLSLASDGLTGWAWSLNIDYLF